MAGVRAMVEILAEVTGLGMTAMWLIMAGVAALIGVVAWLLVSSRWERAKKRQR